MIQPQKKEESNYENITAKTVRPFALRDKFGYLLGDFWRQSIFYLGKFLFNGLLHRYLTY